MWIICAYHSTDTLYTKYAEEFVLSLNRLGLPYEVTSVKNKGDWYSNMQHKPTFLKRMLEKHYPNSVVYIDVDAIICSYPDFFDELDNNSKVNIAVHVLDHSRYKRSKHPPEMLSGTIFLKNTAITMKIMDEWIQKCSENSRLWDQLALAAVLKRYRYYLLPEEYCMIFDYMSNVKNPVIKHFQASRESRRTRTRRLNNSSSTVVRKKIRGNRTLGIRRIRKSK